jgi:hypothetical protein
MLASETFRTPVERRTVTHIQRESSRRFIRLIFFRFLGLTYRGVTVEQEVSGAREKGGR